MSILHKDNNGVIKEYSSGGTIEGLPLGFIFASVFPQSNLNYHLLNGDSLVITDYNDFYTLLTTLVSQNWNLICTANEYAEDIAKTGNCGKFVINSTNSDVTGTYDSTTITVLANSFKLPTITKFIQGLSSLANLGESLEAGLPNITAAANSHNGSLANLTGALKGTSTGSSVGGNTGSGFTHQFIFDASLSNSIYGNSTTVQPQATMYPYYMVVKNNNSTGLISYLNNLAQAGVQSIGGSVGDITVGGGLKMTNNVLDIAGMELLWTNPSPTSNFAAQTIQLANNNFDLFMIKYRLNAANNYNFYCFCKPTEAGVMSYVCGTNVSSGNLLYGMRTITASTQTSITFSGGYYSVNFQSYSTGNNWNIPIEIYGIK